MRFRSRRVVRSSNRYPPNSNEENTEMLKKTIARAMTLSLLAVGSVTAVAMPVASAATHHAIMHAGEDNGDSTTPATVSSGGSGGSSGSGSPSGGVSTGAGGMAESGSADVAPWLAAGGAGIVAIGAGAAASAMARRRRLVNA
jgi:hypothetical protein